MQFPTFIEPDFNREPFISAPDVKTEPAGDGFLPENFYATTIYPEYFKIDGKWTMLHKSRMDCVVVIENGVPSVVEPRRVKKGDEVVVGRKDDGRAGVYVHAGCFEDNKESSDGAFVFRTGQSRESSYSREYDQLYEILKNDRDKGYIVWVLGPACVFDYDSRNAMANLIEKATATAFLQATRLQRTTLRRRSSTQVSARIYIPKNTLKTATTTTFTQLTLYARRARLISFWKNTV